MDKTPEELFKERAKRIDDAIALKIPDRVPIEMALSFFPAKYAGIPTTAAYYDADAWFDASTRALEDLAPDAITFMQSFSPGKAMEMLDPKQTKWPGHGLPDTSGHQAVEGEWMKADEYDHFINEPSDYALRVLLPRTVGVLKPFSQFPRLTPMGYGQFGSLALADFFSKPDVIEAIDTLRKAGELYRKTMEDVPNFTEEFEKRGFPVNLGGIAQAPFDSISDFLRGMQGTMMDMFRQPDKLMEAIDTILENTLKNNLPMLKNARNPRIFMALHRGSDGFMSLPQFEKFYWPGLKKVILAIIDMGLTPGIFFEGDWTQRLEYLTELPKGKVLGHFDSTDLFKAKDILKGHMCIRGNVPASLLQTGTPEDVKEYCKTLIDYVGRDGGLIVCPRSAIDAAKYENLKMMIDFTKEYGVYK